MVKTCLYQLIKKVFPFCSSQSHKHSVKGGGQKESRNRKNSQDLPASEYYKIYQQTKQNLKHISSFSDNELLQATPSVRKRNNSDFSSTHGENSNHNEPIDSNNLRTISSSLEELHIIEKMDRGSVNQTPDIKVKGGIAER